MIDEGPLPTRILAKKEYGIAAKVEVACHLLRPHIFYIIKFDREGSVQSTHMKLILLGSQMSQDEVTKIIPLNQPPEAK